MATTGIAPVKQALVHALRESQPLKDLVGSDGINEGVSPRKPEGEDPYPYIIYSVVSSYREWDGTGMVTVTDIDVWSISDDQVEAHTLDQLVNDQLEDKVLNLELGPTSGQSSLLCRRVSDLSSLDVDGAGHRIYQMGAIYRIWTDQQRTA